MKVVDYLYLARKDLWNFKLRSWLIILCVSLGILVSTLNFYHTSKRAEDLVRGFHGLGGDLITISIQDEDISLKDLSFLAFYFPKISYQITTQGEIKYLRKFRKVSIVGIETGYRDVAAVKVEKGRFLNLGDIKEKRRVCLVNVNLASLFRIKLGDIVEINEEKFGVIGTLKEEMSGGDLHPRVFIPLSISYLFIDFLQNAQNEVIIQSWGQTQDLSKQVEKMLSKRFPSKYPTTSFGENERFLVNTAEGLEKMVRQLKSTARTVTLGVGFLTFLLAGAGIVNLTMLSVRQRYKEIGIMRACGARRQDIFYLFLLEGSLLSFYGLWSGSVVGGIYVTLFGGCRFSLFIEAWLWSSIICMGSSICGYFPASAAANVSPCEAIRDADR